MVAYTAVQSGDWSNPATWGGGGTPSADGDTFSIPAGITVDLDVDLSGLTNGLGNSTVNGTLRAKRAAGTYYLKMNGSITINNGGLVDASDGAGGPYQTDATVTFGFGSIFGFFLNNGGMLNLICAEPSIKYVKLAAPALAGATLLSVDDDVTGDLYWANGSIVRVDNVDTSFVDSEEHTISVVGTDTITLSSGLTNAKLAGAYVLIMTRNVKILRTAGTPTPVFNSNNLITVRAEIRGTFQVGVSGAFKLIGGTISGLSSGSAIAGGTESKDKRVEAVISGCLNAITSGIGVDFAGVISGCSNGFSASGSSCIVSGVITGCALAIDTNQNSFLVTGALINACGTAIRGAGHTLQSVIMQNNNNDFYRLRGFVNIYNSLFGASEFDDYEAPWRTALDYAQSFDHDQVSGAFKAWCAGGIVSTVSSPVFGGRSRSYQHACESADFPVYQQRDVVVPAGQTLKVLCYVRKTVTMAGYLPRFWIFPAEKEPLVSGTPDAEVLMTDSIDTWETLTATVVNLSSAPKIYRVRTLAKSASGNVYFDFDILIGGAGGVSRSRVANA